MRGVAAAAVIGAAASAFFYLAVKFGVDAGFRTAAYVGRWRESRQDREGTP